MNVSTSIFEDFSPKANKMKLEEAAISRFLLISIYRFDCNDKKLIHKS